MSSKPAGRRRRARLIYLPAALLVVVVGLPLYWMLDTALTSQSDLYTKAQNPLLTLAHLGQLAKEMRVIPVARMLSNSAFIAGGTAICSVLLGLLAAYALSRFRFRGKGGAAFMLFATQMVPEGIFLIPIYTLFLTLGLINNLWGLVLVNTAFTLPVSTFIIKAGIDLIPFEIEEAARVDGCPRFGILTSIIVPLVIPSVASAAVLSFFSGWNELMYASTFLTNQSKWPASVELAGLVNNPVANMPVIMAVSLLYSIPAIAFFMLVQRRIVSGLTAGAVKG